MKTVVIVCLSLATVVFGGLWINEEESAQPVRGSGYRDVLIEYMRQAESRRQIVSSLQEILLKTSSALSSANTNLVLAHQEIKAMRQQNSERMDAEIGNIESLAGMSESVRVPQNLVSHSGSVIATNVALSSTYGRWLYFKNSDSRRVKFDLMQIHPILIKAFGLDGRQMLAKHQQLTVDKQVFQIEASKHTAKVASINRQKTLAKAARDLELAKEQERIAEIRRQSEQAAQLENTRLQNERMSADAAMKRADAAMIQALNPASINIQNVQQVGYPYYYYGY